MAMEMKGRAPKMDKVCYVQIRQAQRDAEGNLKVVTTKCLTIHNASISEVEGLLRKHITEEK